MLSDSPPDRDLEWTEAGIEGAWRYLNRLWRMVVEPAAELAPADAPRPELGDAAAALLRDMHKTAAGVTDDLEKFPSTRDAPRTREVTNSHAEFRRPGGTGGGWV